MAFLGIHPKLISNNNKWIKHKHDQLWKYPVKNANIPDIGRAHRIKSGNDLSLPVITPSEGESTYVVFANNFRQALKIKVKLFRLQSTNIPELSPTHFISNIRHQHRRSQWILIIIVDISTIWYGGRRWCWSRYDGDSINMLMAGSLCWWLFSSC